MSDTQRRQVEELFHEVADLPPAQRSPYLDGRCGSDASLRSEIERLLASLDSAALTSLAAIERLDEAEDELAGGRIGPYKLLELIGEGGFGSVYMAEQEEPIRRRVALKIIKLGMDTKQVVARFEAERQALAMMDHPNIAKVFEAGATPTGRPYFVMELVRGIPITKFCDENRLPVSERLRLFTRVCRAVQHAHQKGIIHRDLKPSNVLVTLHDGTPVPMIIDFGIAKATGDRLTDKTLFTAFRQFVGTPPYMSPEQTEMSGLGVDTRSDVYSLGVLLYELLTGTTPFDPKQLRTASYEDVPRLIREQEPPTPSRRLSTLGAELQTIARSRHAEPHALHKLVRGDLDWIVMKALEKDRTRRYESAGGLATDVERHLRQEPVWAGPPSALYQFRKLVLRHRGLFGFLGVLFVVLVGFGVWMTALYADARRLREVAEASERRAQAEADTAEEVVAFLVDLFKVPDPLQAQGENITAREILAQGAARIRARTDVPPATRARLMGTIGHVYTNLGSYSDAAALLRHALEIQRDSLGAHHRDTLGTMNELGRTLMFDGRAAEAEEVLRAAAALGRDALGAEDPAALECLWSLAWTLQSTERFAEAEAIYREVLAVRRRLLGDDHRRTLATIGSLSWVLQRQGDFDGAETLGREALETSRRVYGEDHVYTADAMSTLGMLLLQRHRLAEAAPLLRGAEVVHRRILGAAHPSTIQAMADLASLALKQGRLDEAEEQCRAVLAVCERALGEDHQTTLRCRTQLGGILLDLGRFSEAASVLGATLPNLRQTFGDDSWHTLVCMIRLGRALASAGRLTESEPLLRAAWEGFIRMPGFQVADGFTGLRIWGEILLFEGRLSEAEPLLRTAAEDLRRSLGNEDPATRQADTLLALAASGTGPAAGTERLLREYLALARQQAPEDDWHLAAVNCVLGTCLATQGRYADAEPLLLESYAAFRSGDENNEAALIALRRVVDLYQVWGRPEQAAQWRARVPMKEPLP